jgi:hypothetical protein
MMLVLVVSPNLMEFIHRSTPILPQCSFFSPAKMRMGNVFALVGMGQVENAEKAQGGL